METSNFESSLGSQAGGSDWESLPEARRPKGLSATRKVSMRGRNGRRVESSTSRTSISILPLRLRTTLKTHVTAIAEDVQRLNASMQTLLETLETKPSATENQSGGPSRLRAKDCGQR